jgi:hypothetical protein
VHGFSHSKNRSDDARQKKVPCLTTIFEPVLQLRRCNEERVILDQPVRGANPLSPSNVMPESKVNPEWWSLVGIA